VTVDLAAALAQQVNDWHTPALASFTNIENEGSKVNSPAQPFSYADLSGNMDQGEAIAFVGSRLVLQQIHREHSAPNLAQFGF
jgi:hypothetical protein